MPEVVWCGSLGMSLIGLGSNYLAEFELGMNWDFV